MNSATLAVPALALIASLGMNPGATALAMEDPARIEATLELNPRKLDVEGSKAAGMMFQPSGVKLSDQKPDCVRKEPKYQGAKGAARYGVISLGNGERTEHAVVIDMPESSDPIVYMDLNGNGDLTDDGGAPWPTKQEKEGQPTSYSGTFVFDVTYNPADGSKPTGKCGLNFYWSAERDSINYYRASAREGKLNFGGKSYDVMLVENDNDGLYNKLYDPAKPVAAEKMPRQVTLYLDGDRVDTRANFGFADYNWIARISADGSKMVMEPTLKQIRLPRSVERPQTLGAGVVAPDFEAIMWTPGAAPDAKPTTFKLSDYKGKKVVVIDMWATWCGPCMAGIPHVSKVAEAVKGQDVEVIALNVTDDPAAFEKFAREKGPKYAFKLARDPAGKDREASISARLYKVSGIPQTYVIDKTGKIAASISGYSAGDTQLEEALTKLGFKVK